jgi:hypothetical protein
MSPHICIILPSKLPKRNRKKEGGSIVYVRLKGQQATHENKMPKAT